MCPVASWRVVRATVAGCWCHSEQKSHPWSLSLRTSLWCVLPWPLFVWGTTDSAALGWDEWWLPRAYTTLCVHWVCASVRVCKCSCVHVCIDEGACSCVLVCIYMWKTEVDLIEPGSSGRPVSPRQHHLFYFPRVGLASMGCHTWICMWFIILELLRKAL